MSNYLTDRRARVAKAWNLTNEIVLCYGGELIPVPGGADQMFRFVPDTEYRYLADHDEPGCLVAFDPQSGWVEFRPPVLESERVWEGRPPFDWSEAIRPMTEFDSWLTARQNRPIANLGARMSKIRCDDAATAQVREALMQVRRPKDDIEIARIRAAVAATVTGFRRASEYIKPGVTERQIQVELECEFFRNGGDRPGYNTIVGTGTNAAVLHFTPGKRVVGEDDLVLIDAGAEIEGYTADVTRTYFAKGKPEGFRGELYHAVLSAQKAAVEKCKPGKEFRELHLETARDMTASLVELNILTGDVNNLVERDAHALFFPHGLGHLVGLGVRDASGYLPGRKRSTRFGLAALRIDLPLDVGYVVTVEPGLYFIPALLTDEKRRTQFHDAINWSRVDELLDIGGVRIEDNLLITPEGNENLTAAIPK